MSRSMSGCISAKAATRGARNASRKLSEHVIRSRPVSSELRPASQRSARATSASMLVAVARSSVPAGVSRGPSARRSISRVSRSASMAASLRETVDWFTPRAAAAAESDDDRATARKTRKSSQFMAMHSCIIRMRNHGSRGTRAGWQTGPGSSDQDATADRRIAMTLKSTLTGAGCIAALPAVAAAEMTAMQMALEAGAETLGSDEIAEIIVDKTVKWVAASGDKQVLIHYGDDNTIEGRLIGGNWTGTGFYGVTTDDRICLSWDGRDAGRLRCLHVLMIEDTPHKFRADGSESGALVRIEDGRSF